MTESNVSPYTQAPLWTKSCLVSDCDVPATYCIPPFSPLRKCLGRLLLVIFQKVLGAFLLVKEVVLQQSVYI